MKLYNYNGLNAHDIANNIIANEEKYINTDLDSLTFEEKCNYVSEFNYNDHPLAIKSKNAGKISKLFLEESRKRAETGDALALFNLAYVDHDIFTDSSKFLSCLEKARNAGSYMAHIVYLTCTAKDNMTAAQDMLDELIDKLDSDSLTLEELRRARHLCSTVINYLNKPNKRYEDANIRMARALVLNGHFFELIALKTETAGEGKTFWNTIYFLVDSYFYEKYSISFANGLGEMYILGHGCDPDYEKAKSFYIDLYFKKPIDRSKTLARLGIAEDDENLIKEAELFYKAEIENGSIDGYWKLIVLKVLDGSREQAIEICDTAIKKHPSELKRIFSKARLNLIEYKF